VYLDLGKDTLILTLKAPGGGQDEKISLPFSPSDSGAYITVFISFVMQQNHLEAHLSQDEKNTFPAQPKGISISGGTLSGEVRVQLGDSRKPETEQGKVSPSGETPASVELPMAGGQESGVTASGSRQETERSGAESTEIEKAVLTNVIWNELAVFYKAVRSAEDILAEDSRLEEEALSQEAVSPAEESAVKADEPGASAKNPITEVPAAEGKTEAQTGKTESPSAGEQAESTSPAAEPAKAVSRPETVLPVSGVSEGKKTPADKVF
jgi:hypothetical protein